MLTADIIPLTKLPRHHRQFFTYLVPKHLTEKIQTGSLVMVPLLSRKIKGVVFRIYKQDSSYIPTLKLREIISLLSADNALDKHQLELTKWLSDYYICSLSQALKIVLTPVIYRRTDKKADIVTPTAINSTDKLLATTIWDFLENMSVSKINQDILSQFKSCQTILTLISGQQFNYYDLIKYFVDHKRQVLCLVPEILEAEALYQYYKSKFSSAKIVLWHSNLKHATLLSYLINIKNGLVDIVIGTRMSVFAPFSKLGLIIINEEDSYYYKSWDQQPKYHTRDLALKLAEIHKAKTLLLAEIPSIESYYKVQLGEYRLISVPEVKRVKPLVAKIVSMIFEQKNKNYSLISRQLKSEIKSMLARNKKIILYLDRKGLYALMTCRDCGYTFKCKNCNISVRVYPLDDQKHSINLSVKTNLVNQGAKLLCSYCGYTLEAPLSCPECDSVHFRFVGMGTKQIINYLKESFPKAKILEIDKENKIKPLVGSTGAQQNFDIIIGTQAVVSIIRKVKDISLVAMLNLDIALNFPNFYSGEKTYNLARKLKNIAIEKFIIQTHNPKNQVIRSILADDYKDFFKRELRDRKKFHYPPFSKIIKLEYKHANRTVAEAESQKLYNQLVIFSKNKMVEVSAPRPSLVDKIKNKYSYQIFIKELTCLDLAWRREMLEIIKDKWLIDINPI